MSALISTWYGIKRTLGVEALNRALYRRGFQDLSVRQALIYAWLYALAVYALCVLIEVIV